MRTKYLLTFASIITFWIMGSCVPSHKTTDAGTRVPPSTQPTFSAERQSTPAPQGTPFPTFVPTATLPSPLPTLQLIEPPAGLLFTSFHTAYDHILHQVLRNGIISQVTNADEYEALLSHNQHFVAFIKYILVDAQSSTYVSQLWIRDRSSLVEKRTPSPKNCEIETDMFTWSPDDLRLYYFVNCQHDRDLWYISTKTWKTVNLTWSAKRDELCFFDAEDQCLFNPKAPENLLAESMPIPTLQATVQPYVPQWSSPWRLTEINIDSGEYKILDATHGIFGPPSFSPDGMKIAYDRGFILNKNGNLEKLIPPDFGFKIPQEAVDLVNPSWSPDGKKIAWDAVHIDGWSLTALVIYDVTTKSFQRLLTFEPYYWNISICVCEMWYARPHAWSPDGRYFAYSITEFVDRPASDNSSMFLEEHASLHVFNRDGQEAFSMKGVDGKLAWSPDGQWLAFQASERNVYSIPIFVIHVGDWKAYKVDLPFEDARLIDWIKP